MHTRPDGIRGGPSEAGPTARRRSDLSFVGSTAHTIDFGALVTEGVLLNLTISALNLTIAAQSDYFRQTKRLSLYKDSGSIRLILTLFWSKRIHVTPRLWVQWNSVPTEGPMWGYPRCGLGAVGAILEPFCGHLSPKNDKVS